MTTRVDPAVAEELSPALRVLADHGFTIAATEGGGGMIVAEFRRGAATFLIVKDRGFWHVDGDAKELKRCPSRKTLQLATHDAVEWITRQNI